MAESNFLLKARCVDTLGKHWQRRAQASYPFILQEIEKRMIDRAQIMKPTLGGVTHHGWLHPSSIVGLQALFPQRSIQVIMPVHHEGLFQVPVQSPIAALLKRLRVKSSDESLQKMVWSGHGELPVPAYTQGMVWSPLWLHALSNPQQVLQEWGRVLKPDGALFFSVFGPDTLKELVPFAQALGVALPDFPDMHDWGDLVSHAGFADPVMEMERLTLTYQTPQALLADCRALFGNYLLNRSGHLTNDAVAFKGLVGKQRYLNALNTLEAFRDTQDGRIRLSLELVYGHAWKVVRSGLNGEAVIPISAIGGRKSTK